MTGSLMLGINPSRRHGRRKMSRKARRVYRLRRNPSRGMALGSGMSGIGPILSNVLPIAGGFIGGLVVPKMLQNTTPAVKYLVPAGIGIVVPMVLSGIIGRKNAVLIGVGSLVGVAVQAVDDLLLKKQGKQLLADDGVGAGEIRVIEDSDMSDGTDVFNDEDMSDDPFEDDDGE